MTRDEKDIAARKAAAGRSHDFTSRKRATLRRRGFLKGAGGLALGLPLLHSLEVEADTPPPIKRLVLMYNPNGTIEDAFWPTSGGETDFVLGEMLSPLEAWRDKLLLTRGIDLKVTSTGPGGPHQRGIGGLFTGKELQKGEFADGCGSLAGWANGQSVDQAYVDHLGVVTAIPSLELGIRATAAEVRSRIVYGAPGSPLPPTNDPHQVWSRLFSGIAGDPDTRLVQFDKRKSVLDAVQGQFALLNRRVSNEDRQKLEAHAEMVRELEQRLQLAANAGVEALAATPAPSRQIQGSWRWTTRTRCRGCLSSSSSSSPWRSVAISPASPACSSPPPSTTSASLG